MIYDHDYYENGIETGKSCYQNYRWMPELTIPMAMTIIDYLGIKRKETILDIGCAKGYLVKAFRLLYRKAYGVDISQYAISQVDHDVHNHCVLGTLNGSVKLPLENFSVCIAKDVFEHIQKPYLMDMLKNIPSDKLFAVIPLGNGNGQYIAPMNNMDRTHIVCEPVSWWMTFFELNQWQVETFAYKVSGIKDNYYATHPKAHGFFTLRKL